MFVKTVSLSLCMKPSVSKEPLSYGLNSRRIQINLKMLLKKVVNNSCF